MNNKGFDNIPVVYREAIKRIYGRNSHGGTHECLEYARLPIFKYFLARKFVCSSQRFLSQKARD